MKTGRHSKRFAPILCVFAASAICLAYSCDEKNSKDDSTIPLITSVQIIMKNDPNNPIDASSSDDPIEVYETEELTYRVHYTDYDCDANVLIFNRFYPSSNPEPLIGQQIEMEAQTEAEASYKPDEYGFFGGFIGSWRLVFIVKDRMGHMSEPVDLLVQVLQSGNQPPVVPPDELCDGEQPMILNASIFRADDPDTPLEPNAEDEIEVFLNEYLIWQVDYTDEDKDVEHVKTSSFHPSYQLTPTFSATYRIHQVKIDDFYRHTEPGFFGGDPGIWRLEFELEDACRHRSDEYAIWVNVLEP